MDKYKRQKDEEIRFKEEQIQQKNNEDVEKMQKEE